ncbi:hypothetical protein [Streptomyces sp. PKU-EA00015]|nr:hypothetical protein [Streptomyces sp. PKU-EA00015]
MDDCRSLAATSTEVMAAQLAEVCDEVAVDIDERVAGPEGV